MRFIRITKLLITLILTTRVCYALDLNSPPPEWLLKNKPTTKHYTTRAFVEAFYTKWAESIENEKDTVNTKTLGAEYKGITWGKEITSDIFPKMTLTGTDGKNILSCKLYSGVVNKAAYSKLKSPILHNADNNVCVVITSV